MGFEVFNRIVWRAVEIQARSSTSKLVPPNDEHVRLESMIEESKPSIPPLLREFNFLINTPFRYPSDHGSRFGRPNEKGIFYAACDVETCVAEFTFYRLLFFLDSPDTPWPENPLQAIIFNIPILSSRFISYPEPEDLDYWSNLDCYPECREFADHIRRLGCEVIGFRSARNHNGYNVAIFSGNAFNSRLPDIVQTWHINLSAEGAFARGENPPKYIDFGKGFFNRDRRLRSFNWERPILASTSTRGV